MTVEPSIIQTDFETLRLETARRPKTFATVVTIGNFDGCHLGHQTLINKTILDSREESLTPAVVTFDPHPEAYFRGLAAAKATAAPSLLFTAAQKSRAFQELGLELEVRQRFDAAFCQVTHEDFYADHLGRQLNARTVVIGADFRFGAGRRGDTAFLEARGRDDGRKVVIAPAARHGDEPISSTRIRSALVEAGDVETVKSMLGRPYMLQGRIVHGDKIGRTMQVPTANLGDVQQVVPRNGVYVGWVWLGAAPGDPKEPRVMHLPIGAVPATFNIGVRPTLANPKPSLRIEAHLLTGTYGADSLYDLRVGYYLTHRLRDERRFPGLAELKTQIAADNAAARILLNIN